MLKQILVETARQQYRIGAIVESAFDNTTQFEITANTRFYAGDSDENIKIFVKEEGTNAGVTLYYNGKWAKRLKTPTPSAPQIVKDFF